MIEDAAILEWGDVGFIDSGGLSAGRDAFYSYADRHPFATLAIYRNRLVISSPAPRRTYEFAPDDIIHIVHEDYLWMTRQFRITHRRSEYPPYMAFRPLNPDLVLDGFRRVGYSVDII